MVIHCLAYVGKGNEPLFVHVDSTTISTEHAATNIATSTMYLESIVHASADIIEERRARKQQPNTNTGGGMQEMFLGQLFVVEDYRVFAWCSNTHIKTIIICDITTSEMNIKDILHRLYNAYILCTQNPFQNTGQQLLQSTSKRLKAYIQQQIQSYNDINL